MWPTASAKANYVPQLQAMKPAVRLLAGNNLLIVVYAERAERRGIRM
jgi:hypothetical protein